jgi:hypothetical protein
MREENYYNKNIKIYQTNPNKEIMKKTEKDMYDTENTNNNILTKTKVSIFNPNTSSTHQLNQRSSQYPLFKGNKDSKLKTPKYSLNTFNYNRLENQNMTKLDLGEYGNQYQNQIEENKEKENICIINSHFLKEKDCNPQDEEKEKENQKDKNENTNSNIYKVMKKIQKHSNQEMMEKIEKKFETAEEYLKHDDNIIFGKKLIASNFSNIKGKKPHHVIGKLNEFIDLEKNKNNFFTSIKQVKKANLFNAPKFSFYNVLSNYIDRGNFNNNSSPNNKKVPEIENHNMEFISDEKIQMFFDERKLKKSNLYNIENEVVQNVDIKFKDKMKILFNKQNNIMEKKAKAEQSIKTVSKSLALKVNKNEDELLFNSTDGFRLKKEIQNAFEQADQKGSKYGFCNDWIFTLRESINKFKKAENKKRRMLYDDDKNKKDRNKKENKVTFSPLETRNSNLFSPLQTTRNQNQGLLTTSSYFNPMNTETRFIQVNPLNNGVIYVSLNDPLKKKASSNMENNIFKSDKIRKPEINQSKYLKNYINCKPVKEKLKEINYLNSDIDNIGNLIVIFFI